eukprot:EC796878.1.p2 GENE.EC796878.1~~EC796878.1.p2  ORF type:complete len:175 (+),score=54.79 EC796878.1:136-660(+)
MRLALCLTALVVLVVAVVAVSAAPQRGVSALNAQLRDATAAYRQYRQICQHLKQVLATTNDPNILQAALQTAAHGSNAPQVGRVECARPLPTLHNDIKKLVDYLSTIEQSFKALNRSSTESIREFVSLTQLFKLYLKDVELAACYTTTIGFFSVSHLLLCLLLRLPLFCGSLSG